MLIAFYKGQGSTLSDKIFHKLVTVIDRTPYSHCEVVFRDECYSSSNRDKGVRKKSIDLTSGNWDIVDVSHKRINELDFLEFFNQTESHSYDYFGLLWHVSRLFRSSKNAWVCSEWCAESLGLAGTHKLTPKDLYEWATKGM